MTTHHNVEVIVLRSRGRSLVEPQAVAERPRAQPAHAPPVVHSPPVLKPVDLDELRPLESWDDVFTILPKVQAEVIGLKSQIRQLAQVKGSKSTKAELRVTLASRQQQLVELHGRAARLREKIRQENIRTSNNRDRVFKRMAYEMLPPDLFEKIQQAATDAWLEMDDDEPGTECAGPESETPPSRSPTA